MEDRKDVTVPMPKSWRDEIDNQLEYGDSRSEWIREAIRQKLVNDGVDPEMLENALGDSGNPNRAAVPTSD